LRPIASHLARTGVTANQVTIASLAGSLLVSALLCGFANSATLFALLPVWVLVRMACATIDGTLAVEFGQKSRLGGILNEAGDIISEIGLFLPLAFVAPFSKSDVTLLIFLAVMSELAGMVGPLLGSSRRLEGPLGKADRSIVLALIGMAIVVLGRLPERAFIIVPILVAGLLMTIWNRARFALADPCGNGGPK
jgi:CDP-diacylglycerol--glycerol-3-phosphate 3-phosphatidyltransferase